MWKPDVTITLGDEPTHSLELRTQSSVRTCIPVPVCLVKFEIALMDRIDCDRLKEGLRPAVLNTLIGHLLLICCERMLSLAWVSLCFCRQHVTTSANLRPSSAGCKNTWCHIHDYPRYQWRQQHRHRRRPPELACREVHAAIFAADPGFLIRLQLREHGLNPGTGAFSGTLRQI